MTNIVKKKAQEKVREQVETYGKIEAKMEYAIVTWTPYASARMLHEYENTYHQCPSSENQTRYMQGKIIHQAILEYYSELN